MSDLFPRQVTCQRAVRLEVPADAAWAVVGDIGSEIPGAGMIERVEVSGAGEGAERVFFLAGGARIRERIEAYDPDERFYVYRILDPGPLDCVRYLGLAQVTPAGDGGCILSWMAMADPVGDADTLRGMLGASLEGALAAVSEHLRKGS